MRLPWLAGCAIIAMLPLLWLPVAGPVQSGGRERTGAGADSSAWKGRRRSGDDASAGGLGVLSAHQALWPTRHLTGAIRQAEVILSETDGQTLHRGQMVRLRGRYLFPR